MNKRKIAVLFGGRSSEHEISLISAASVIQHLDQALFEVVPIAIDKQGRWLLHDIATLNYEDNAIVIDEEAAPLSLSLAANSFNAIADVVFPVIHGENCEDGRLQGVLEALKIPYVGSGVSGSAVMMDKVLSNYVAEQVGANVPDWISFRAQQWEQNKVALIAEIEEKLTFPMFVKPVVTGSSIGVSKVSVAIDLIAAIEEAFEFDTHVMVENGVIGRELEIAVLENIDDITKPLVSMPGEIVLHHDFYSYAAKYLDEDAAGLDLSPQLPKGLVGRMQKTAACLFKAMNAEGLGRADFLYDDVSDKLYFNEINSLPGFTSISMYPKMWGEAGLGYKTLLTKLVDLAVARFERTSVLKSSPMELAVENS